MQDFKRAMVYCAAISLFGAGAFTTYSGVDAMQTQKVKSIVAAEVAAGQSRLGDASNVDNTRP